MVTAFFHLKPKPPFRLDLTAWTLRRMPQNQIDRWDGLTYSRVLTIDRQVVNLTVRQPGDHTILAGISSRTADPDLKQRIVPLIEKMLGIRKDLSEFQKFASQTREIAALALNFRGFKPPRFPTVYEALINALACQQLSLHVCIVLLNRLGKAWGRAWTEAGKTYHAFPLAHDLAKANVPQLRALGFSSSKAAAIVDISRQVHSGALDLDRLEREPDAAVMQTLTQLPGIGPWSAEYVMLRGLGRTHIFPGEDSGAMKSLQQLLNLKRPLDAAGTSDITRRWHPYAGLLYFHFLLNRLRNKGCLA